MTATEEASKYRGLTDVVAGIDTSGDFQNMDVWAKAKPVFGWTKTNEGRTFIASLWGEHRAAARGIGCLIGPYSYARPASNTPDAEVAAMIATAGTDWDLPPMLDLETGSALGRTKLTAWVETWCTQAARAFGRPPVFYCSAGAAMNLGLLDATRIRPLISGLMVPSYGHGASSTGPDGIPGEWGTWDIWQFAASSNLGSLDLNIARGAWFRGITGKDTMTPEQEAGMHAAINDIKARVTTLADYAKADHPRGLVPTGSIPREWSMPPDVPGVSETFLWAGHQELERIALAARGGPAARADVITTGPDLTTAPPDLSRVALSDMFAEIARRAK